MVLILAVHQNVALEAHHHRVNGDRHRHCDPAQHPPDKSPRISRTMRMAAWKLSLMSKDLVAMVNDPEYGGENGVTERRKSLGTNRPHLHHERLLPAKV